MGYLELIILLLFVTFFATSISQVVAMLGRKRQGEGLDKDRLLFFFFATLLLVCLVSLGIFELLSTAVIVSNLCVVLVNLTGFLLTFNLAREARAEGEEEPADAGGRAYQVYYEGRPLGVVTKEGFDRLMASELLKKQRTVELIADYKERAREQGVSVVLLQNRDGTQKLLKVEMPKEIPP